MAKKILLVSTCFRPNVGGVETHLDDLIAEGVSLGKKFVVITYQPLVTKAAGALVERNKGVTIYRVPWIGMSLFLKLVPYPTLEFLYLFPGIFIFTLLYLLANSKKISTIHAQGLSAGVVGVAAAKLFRKKVIISTHSIYNFPKSGLYPLFVRYLFNSCDHVLTLSRQSKDEVKKLGVSENKISTFTYWVDQRLFRPSSKSGARAKLNLNKESFICLFVGRLVEVKGVGELLQAVEIANKKITFLVVGDGPMKSKVKKMADIKDNLVFAGKIDNNKLPLYYNAADLLIVPSIHEEGFGRVILEALSCGLPIIASNRGGIREALSCDVGVLIDINPKNIKHELEKFYSNRKKLDVYSSKATSYARKFFGKKNAQLIFKYYEKD